MIPQPIDNDETRREAGLSPPEPPMNRWHHALKFISAWWVSAEWYIAWPLLALMLANSLGGVYITLELIAWQQSFFDAIQQQKGEGYFALMLAYIIILCLQILTILCGGLIGQYLSLRWRTWLTDNYLSRWMDNDRYYMIEHRRMIDNPDQRISEDLRGLTDRLPTLFTGTISTIVGTVGFVLVLLKTSQSINFSLLGMPLSIPGDNVIYGFAYALAGSIAIVYIGKPFIRYSQRQQHYEADFRASMLHVRRNAAQISLVRNAPAESSAMQGNFQIVRQNIVRLMFANLGLSAGQSTYERLSLFIPFAIMVPRFFAGQMTFGQVMASREAFGQLVGNLSYFIQMYPVIGAQIANINRIKALDDALQHAEQMGTLKATTPDTDYALTTHSLKLQFPNGSEMVTIGDWQVGKGEKWVITGASGAGKSTLVRAVAGLWPDGIGEIKIASDCKVMFVAQRLYLPLGTLKEALCFADVGASHDDQTLLACLDRVGLGRHGPALNESRMWQDDLSPGEQQRLALARILLQRPTLLVLDEATSALDEQWALKFYSILADVLPETTIISVVHDKDLLAFHTHSLTIIDGAAHPALIAAAQRPVSLTNTTTGQPENFQ
ncbi:MAG: ABC transporter ATP-binding protein/permease [Sphingobium sp.]|nr:ABC transporter ATP-binding protein/permease [Sphingobium sp.]